MSQTELITLLVAVGLLPKAISRLLKEQVLKILSAVVMVPIPVATKQPIYLTVVSTSSTKIQSKNCLFKVSNHFCYFFY